MKPGNSIGERPTQESTDAERLAWLALASIEGIGARRIAALVSRFGSAPAVLEAGESELADVDGLNLRTARLVRSANAQAALRLVRDAERASTNGSNMPVC